MRITSYLQGTVSVADDAIRGADQRKNGTVVVLDVRDREEFAGEHIPGAMDHRRLLLLHLAPSCPSAALMLAENGFPVHELIGDIEDRTSRASLSAYRYDTIVGLVLGRHHACVKPAFFRFLIV